MHSDLHVAYIYHWVRRGEGEGGGGRGERGEERGEGGREKREGGREKKREREGGEEREGVGRGVLCTVYH